MESKEVDIRACTRSELQVLEELGPSEAGFSSAAYENQITGIASFLIAWRKGIPLGWCEVVYSESAEIEIRSLHVRSEFRRMGVGTLLVHFACDRVADDLDVNIKVDRENSGAARLYERLGFVQTGEISTLSYDYVNEFGLNESTTETYESLRLRRSRP